MQQTRATTKHTQGRRMHPEGTSRAISLRMFWELSGRPVEPLGHATDKHFWTEPLRLPTTFFLAAPARSLICGLLNITMLV